MGLELTREEINMYTKHRTAITLSNLTLRVCDDIIREYHLTVEDAELLLRITKWKADKREKFEAPSELEDVDMNAPVIDPPDYDYHTFANYG